ncbi:hypothetical protein F5X68DRAFT_215827 [Plectosphaerella plurivora]|uniref:Uncharacterized protein n=1 Tax=Plectosphaerella plurivora TaxID=936078 RepID=A0A9P9A4P0_9PEZI|nr:hypothetical protein F5X68DRAFT_215827 [Plectosphaerella plurivora]
MNPRAAARSVAPARHAAATLVSRSPSASSHTSAVVSSVVPVLPVSTTSASAHSTSTSPTRSSPAPPATVASSPALAPELPGSKVVPSPKAVLSLALALLKLCLEGLILDRTPAPATSLVLPPPSLPQSAVSPVLLAVPLVSLALPALLVLLVLLALPAVLVVSVVLTPRVSSPALFLVSSQVLPLVFLAPKLVLRALLVLPTTLLALRVLMLVLAHPVLSQALFQVSSRVLYRVLCPALSLASALNLLSPAPKLVPLAPFPELSLVPRALLAVSLSSLVLPGLLAVLHLALQRLRAFSRAPFLVLSQELSPALREASQALLALPVLNLARLEVSLSPSPSSLAVILV